MGRGRRTSRRTVEITYDLRTRGAVAEIKKFARQNGIALNRVRQEAKRTGDELQSLRRGAIAVGAALVGAIAAEKTVQGFRSIIDITREYRGESDELTQAINATGSELAGLGAALGTVLFGAAQEGGALGTLNEGIRNLRDDILNADSAVGGFVRGSLSAMVSFGALAATAMVRLTQGVLDFVDTISSVSREAESTLFAGDIERLEEDAARARDIARDLRNTPADLTPEQRLDVNQGILSALADAQRFDAEIEAIREGPLGGLRAELDEIRRRVAQRTLDADELVGGIATFAERLKAGLEQSFDLADAHRTAAEGTADAMQDQVLAAQDLIALALQAATIADNLASKGGGDTKGDPRAKTDALTDALRSSLQGGADALNEAAIAAQSLESVIVGSVPSALGALSQMQAGLGRFFARGLRGVGAFGDELRLSLAGVFSGIGGNFASAAASVAVGASTGPFGLFLALGGAFSILGGLLGGLGGGGKGRGLSSPTRSPAVLSTIRPEVSGGGGGSVNYIVNTGATFFGGDDSRRGIVDQWQQGVRFGEVAPGR